MDLDIGGYVDRNIAGVFLRGGGKVGLMYVLRKRIISYTVQYIRTNWWLCVMRPRGYNLYGE